MNALHAAVTIAAHIAPEMKMHWQITTAVTLMISTTQALSILSSLSILQLPSLNITLPTHNLTIPPLKTSFWPSTPIKVDLEELDSYMLIQNIVTREVHYTDYDESVCASIEDIIRLKFGKKGSKKPYVNNVREVDGHVSFTLKPLEHSKGVTKEEVAAMLWQFWWMTSEHGAATLWGTYFSKGFEGAEIGLLLN